MFTGLLLIFINIFSMIFHFRPVGPEVSQDSTQDGNTQESELFCRSPDTAADNASVLMGHCQDRGMGEASQRQDVGTAAGCRRGA